MKRRPFLKLSGGLAGAFLLGNQTSWSFDPAAESTIVDRVNGMPYRTLGRTGRNVSVIGYPGFAVVRGDQEEATKNVVNAFDKGINFFDVAPQYGDGEAEIKLGHALKELNRDEYFLACKTNKRDKATSREELERSLDRLHTDHFDLYQMHVLRTKSEVDQAFGPGGCMETLLEAQKEGKIRHLGFSAHTTKAALQTMESHTFDTVMFPINFIEFYAFGFGQEVMDKAAEQGAAVLALKPMCGGKWKDGERDQAERKWWYRALEDQTEINNALNFSLSLKNVTLGIPPAYLDLADRGFVAGAQYHVPTDEEMESIKSLAESSLSVFEERQQDYFSMANHEIEQEFGCMYSVG